MSTQEQIEQLIKNHDVVLFMKGSRMFPQCGFSSRATQILKQCGIKFKDVNVLADPAIRQGIKDFSNWPTIPQCYVKGEFVGGSDILQEMFENGELQEMLGMEAPKAEPAKAPKITITDAAKGAFEAALGEAAGDVLRFDVASGFRYDLYLGPKKSGDLVSETNGLSVHVLPASAATLDGTTIDFVDGPQGAGFKIDNPNEPPAVKELSPAELKAKLDGNEDLHLFDVRTEQERQIAVIDGAKALGPDGLEGLAKDSAIVLHCHHGVRSRQAGQQLIEQGFTQVYNLSGGIDAWSVQVDESVPRY